MNYLHCPCFLRFTDRIYPNGFIYLAFSVLARPAREIEIAKQVGKE